MLRKIGPGLPFSFLIKEAGKVTTLLLGERGEAESGTGKRKSGSAALSLATLEKQSLKAGN